jgi:hypothetical protein
MEAKTREFHEQDSLLAGRESLCRDNTIEGNVGVRDESHLAARMAATMARPGPQGNRRARLFPRLLPIPSLLPRLFPEAFAGLKRLFESGLPVRQISS